jgi:hypothetical protein
VIESRSGATDLLRRHLAVRLGELFDRHRVVVWEDDSATLASLLRETLPPGVTMPAFTGNPLSLRQTIDRDDPWLERKWLLYVPALPAGVEPDWLVDHEQAFCHLPQANLAWALHGFFGLPDTPETRRLLRGPAASRVATSFDRYVGDVERVSEEDVLSALLRAAIGAAEADDSELVLRYLVVPADAQKWETEGLLPALTALIKSRKRLALRRHLVDGHPPDRGALARCLLASSLAETGAVDGRPLANHLPDPGARPRWRKTLELGLANAARRDRLIAVLQEHVEGSELSQVFDDPLRLASGPALPFLDAKMQWLLLRDEALDPAKLPAWWAKILEVATARLAQPHLDESVRRTWRVLRDASNLLIRAGRRADELTRYPPACLDRLVREYAETTDGDWQLDALYRGIAQDDPGLPEELRVGLVQPAREAYHRWTRELTRRFVQAVEAGRAYAVPGVLPHTRFWSEMVDRPGRSAVLIVDALRADLAFDLAGRLQRAGRQVEYKTALATLPSRTEVGMAALLPRAEDGFAVKVEEGRLMASIGTTRLPSVTERTKHLEAISVGPGRIPRRRPVEDFLDRDAHLLRECLRDGLLPVAHTTDLDEGGDIAAKVTFRVFDEVLEVCSRFADRALAVGFAEVVVAGDHGFLVRDPQAAPGGIPGTGSAGGRFARGLRYAAGVGAVGPELFRLGAAEMGRSGDDVYVPRDTSCLAIQGGAGLFVHGGLSPQECALVFLRVLPGAAQGAAETLPVSLRVQAVERSLAFKVHAVAGPVRQPLFVEPRAVLVQVEDAAGKAVFTSDTFILKASASEQAVSLTLKVPRGGEYGLCLYEASSGRLIVKHMVQVEVLGDDFGF